jgi:ligand-binding sensor domain-containing protein
MIPLSVNPLSKISAVSLIFIVLFGIHNSLGGQSTQRNIKFTNISIKNGLSQSSPNCIFQDSRGLLWIGTEDGLNRYDGYTFMVYKSQSENRYSISNSRILSICEDNRGNLWVGTNGGGLNKLDRVHNQFYQPGNKDKRLYNDLPQVISCLLCGQDSLLWVGAHSGLALINTFSMEFLPKNRLFPELMPLTNIPVNTLISGLNKVWIGTRQGLFSFDLSSKKLVRYFDSELADQDHNITALIIDRKGNLIAGSDEGLFMLDMGSSTLKKVRIINNPVNGYSIKALLEDEEGNIWAGTVAHGLLIGSAYTGYFENYLYDHLNPYSLKNNEVLSIYKDYSGIIWVGTNGLDMYNHRKEKFILYDYVPYTQEQLVFRNIHPIYVDKYGVLWVGSKTDGLHILDRDHKRYSRLLKSNGLSSNRVRAIKEFPEGVLWVGTEDEGLDKVYLDASRRPVRFKNYKSQPGNPNSLTSNKIYAFYADTKGQLWIGTDNGLTIMNPETETFTQYLPDTDNPTSLSNGTVYSIFGDSRNDVWLATDLGVNKFDRASGGFVRFNHQDNNKNSVIHNEILCFHEDNQGFLWIGTYGKGFDKFDPVKKVFTHFNEIKEVSTAVVYGILEDNHDNLWLSTNNGILLFNKETNKISTFNIEDGLQSNEFNGTSYFRNGNGEMFFGGQYGFNSFFPENVKVDSIAPRIILSDLQVHNVSVVPGSKAPIDRDISEAHEIVLHYKQNNFTLYFSALHFANPSRNKYKYMLEGFDKGWVDAGNKRFVTYTNLACKTYTFHVRASNSDGVWNNKGLSIKIKVKPPVWATIWFRILVGLVIAGLAYYFIQRRLTRDERQKKIIEEKFNASSRELEEARVQLQNQHDEIIMQKRELVQRQKDQENLLWFNQGLGLFSDLISKNRESLGQLCGQFIEKLVDYVGAQQGGLFLFQDDDHDSPLHLVAHYAYAISRTGQKIGIGEGYVGTCFKEKKFLEIDNLSEQYSILSSGLGSMPVKHLVLAPLVVNEDCIGVIELGSFKKIKGYRISFIEKLVETFASTIHTEQANNRLTTLIEQSGHQAKELAENEEKLRQNLEELMTAQEESSCREDELIKMAEESATREEMLSQEIEMLKNQVEQLNSQLPTN